MKAKKIKIPRWDDRKGWTGGELHRLYAFTCLHTGQVQIRPAGLRPGDSPGPNCDVRPARRAEAEEGWQRPLHSGWKVVEPPKPCDFDRRARSPAAREAGCPLDHCACGTHDAELEQHECVSQDKPDDLEHRIRAAERAAGWSDEP